MNESLGLFGWTKLNVYGERNGAIYLAKWYLFEHICQTEFFFLFYFETNWWRELKNLGKYFNKLKKRNEICERFPMKNLHENMENIEKNWTNIEKKDAKRCSNFRNIFKTFYSIDLSKISDANF